MKKTRNTLLVIRTSALGDVAMTIPAIYSLANQYPAQRILVVTRTPFDQLFVDCPPNTSLFIADWEKRHHGLMGILRLFWDLSGEGICAVADLHNVFRSWLIDACFLLRGTPVRMLCKGRLKRKELTHRNGKAVQPQRPYTLRYADVFKRLGFPIELTFGGLCTHDSARCRQKRAQVGIAPFARYATKTYPPELMEEVVASLANQGCDIFLFGSKGEEAQTLRRWAAKHKRCNVLAGTLTLGEELLAMARLDVMLAMDSANMHMASLVGTPVVSVWGSTTPACGFLGWQQTEDLAVCKHLPCQPCSVGGRPRCPLRHFACMRTIPPSEIVERVNRTIHITEPQTRSHSR